MGASGVPDIAVRLSAQGVQDVVNAFQRVRQEARRTGEAGAAGLGLINGALETMYDLLPQLTAALAITKIATSLVSVSLNARETAENMGKLSEKTGANVGTLSVLNLVAHDSEIEFEALNNGLVKLAKNQEDASNGSAKQKKAFSDLGISLKQLKTQDPGQLFVSVAQALDKLPDGAHKAQIAIALFGKAGAELLPMLQALGANGFEEALAKAKRLGIYLDQDMVQASRNAQDAIHELEDIANGLGTRFVSGFTPGFTQGIETIAESLEGQGVDSMRKFGEHAADVFKGIIGAVQLVGATIKILFKDTVTSAELTFGSIKSLLQGFSQGGVGGAIGALMNYKNGAGADLAAQMSKNDSEYFKSLYDFQAKLTAPPERTSSKRRPGAGGSGTGEDEAGMEKAANARSAYLQSLADNELAILKLKNQMEESEDKRNYDAGILTLDQYYDRREQRIKDESDKELDVLKQKQDAVNKLPDSNDEQHYKKLQAQAAVQTQITETQIRNEGLLKDAEAERFKAKHDAAIAEMNDIEKLQRLSGDRYGAEETALNIELQQYQALLAKQGKSVEEIEAATEAYARRGQAKVDFGRSQQAGSSAINDLGLGIDSIQNQAANGSISNIQAQAQILELQRESLETLSQIGLQMFKNAVASEDPKAIDTANQYNAAVQRISSSLKNVTTAQTYLVNELTGTGISAITDFFTEGISGSKSFGDALGDLASTFESIVSSMIAKLLVYYAILELVGWIAPGSNLQKTLTAAGPFGSLTGHAAGGWTGDGPTNVISGVTHGQEFVVRAGPASKYRQFLQAINDGQTPEIASTHSVSSSTGYANELNSGDTNISVASGAPAPIVQVINGTGQPTSQKQTTGAGGQSITQIIVGAVAQDIAQGGQVAKALQSNYGAARQGVRRG